MAAACRATAGHRELVGNRHDDVGRPRGSGGRRAGHEHHPEDRRQHVRVDPFFGTGLNSTLQSDNFTERVITAGLTRPNRIDYNYDTSVSGGGPIVKDRLWYYGLVYYRGAGNDISMFHNKNAGDLTKWTYEADLSHPAKSDSNGPLQPNLRLTWQANSRNKLNLFWDEQISSNSIGQGSDGRAGNGRLEPRLPARAAGQVDLERASGAVSSSRRAPVPGSE